MTKDNVKTIKTRPPINPKRGDVFVEGVGVVRFTWQRMEMLVDVLGDDFEKVVAESVTAGRTMPLAEALSIGAGVPVKEILEASPPIMNAWEGFSLALRRAVHGDKPLPENNLEAEGGDDSTPPKSTGPSATGLIKRNLQRLGLI